MPARPAPLRAELPAAPRRARRGRPRRRRRAPRARRRWSSSTSPAAAPRTSATSPAASTLLPPGRHAGRRPAPRATASTASPARSRGALPLDGAFVKAHGRVFWLDPPRAAARRRSRPGRATPRPRRNADGFLTAPGMFSPDHADPGSRRLAAALAGRLAGRVADLGAGWGWLAQAALAQRARRSPSSTSTRPRRWRSTPPAPTSPTRARASTGPTSTGLGAGVAALRRGDRQPALPPGPRRRARPRRRLHRRRRAHPEARRAAS